MAKRIAGIVSFTIDGISYNVKDGVVYQPTMMKRDPLIGATGKLEYSEMVQQGHIAANLFFDGTYTLSDLNGLVNSIVSVIAANGTNIIATSAFQSGDLEPNVVEGTVAVRFESQSVQEVIPNV